MKKLLKSVLKFNDCDGKYPPILIYFQKLIEENHQQFYSGSLED